MVLKMFSHKVVPPLLTLLLFTAACEVLVQTQVVSDFIVPSPTQVWAVMEEEADLLQEATWTTMGSACAGLGLSFFVGSLFALVLSWSSVLRRAFYPYAVFFQTVPVISLAPLLVIWFGFGQPTAIASSFIVSIFPVIANTLAGLQSTDPQLIELFHLYKAQKRDVLFKLRLPFALADTFTGLRIASGLAVVGAIVGEFIGGGGLGSVVDAARTQQRVDLVFAAVLASSLLGLLLLASINYVSRYLLRHWHASEQAPNKI